MKNRRQSGFLGSTANGDLHRFW